jgi:hypothetical protein
MNAVVIRAEMMFHKNAIEYIAISPLFEENPDYCIPPAYSLEILTDKETGDRYQKYGHLSDGMDYFLVSLFEDFYD